jgi:hypothetical protein
MPRFISACYVRIVAAFADFIERFCRRAHLVGHVSPGKVYFQHAAATFWRCRSFSPDPAELVSSHGLRVPKSGGCGKARL